MTERPAYPTVCDNAIMPGMTLREWYAGQALPIIATYPAARSSEALSDTDVAKWAFQIADAMLAESRKEPKP